MPKLVFRNVHTGNKYEVVKFDQEKGEVTLKGPHTGTPFSQKFNKDHFERMGYVLEQERA